MISEILYQKAEGEIHWNKSKDTGVFVNLEPNKVTM